MMKYLLDTHTAFWYLAGRAELSTKAKAAIDDSENEIFVSIVSAWEIAIKRSLGRQNTSLCSSAEFFDEIGASGFRFLPLEQRHVCLIETMPFHHRDPFDRLLIATAMADDLTFLSADKNVPKYDVRWLW
jgi:PIN domain nuclease of toxin-antitoxin system